MVSRPRPRCGLPWLRENSLLGRTARAPVEFIIIPAISLGGDVRFDAELNFRANTGHRIGGEVGDHRPAPVSRLHCFSTVLLLCLRLLSRSAGPGTKPLLTGKNKPRPLSAPSATDHIFSQIFFCAPILPAPTPSTVFYSTNCPDVHLYLETS